MSNPFSQLKPIQADALVGGKLKNKNERLSLKVWKCQKNKIAKRNFKDTSSVNL